MKLGTFLRCLCIASGVVAGTAVAISRARTPRKKLATMAGRERISVCGSAMHADASAGRSQPNARTQRDYFSITKMRGAGEQRKWLLQGFGRYQCFLLFDSWQQAMQQASFRMEKLAAPELIQLNLSLLQTM